ncbi:unnamed protein product, partial [Porites evermanni]
PSKQRAKGSEFFSFTIQEEVQKIEALCFSPKKHKGNVVSRVESGLPCKLTKFSFHKTEDNVNWVNTATQINDALEATLDFCREANDNKTPVANTKDVDNIQVIKVSQFMAWLFLEITRQNLSLTKLILSKRKDPCARIRNYADHNLEQTN